MSDPEVELGRLAERIKALVDKSDEVKKTAEQALAASNTAKSDSQNATGEIKRLEAPSTARSSALTTPSRPQLAAATEAREAQKDTIRAEIWKDLYGSVWKPIALVALIVGVLSAGANFLTTYLLASADPHLPTATAQ